MILDLIEKLADRCMKLAQSKAERKRRFFDEFVTPCFEQFDAVHRNYMTDFQRYRRTLSDATSFNEAYYEISEAIKNRLLYSDDFRSKALLLSKAVYRANRDKSERVSQLLGSFLEAIYSYLTVANFNENGNAAELYRESYNNQRWASTVLSHLQELDSYSNTFDAEKLDSGIAHVDAAVAEMQYMYWQVSGDYFTLKPLLMIERDLFRTA